MASEPPRQQPEGTATPPPDQLLVNLQVVSPSAGVTRPLLFPGLPATTTIKQLKERIRQTLPQRPTDEHQRLIHRGRVLARESDSLLDVIGQDGLQTPDQHTLHLVIRDQPNAQPPVAATTPTPSQIPAPTFQIPNGHLHHPPHVHPGGQPAPGSRRGNPLQQAPNPFPQPRMPSPAAANLTPEQVAAAQQQQRQHMSHWLAHVQREAMTRNMINQNQRNRAHMGMRGVGDPAGGHGGATPEMTGGASPAPSQTYYRETVGPNGQTIQVETTTRSFISTPQGGISRTDVQNILRGADVAHGPLAMPNGMQRSDSAASLHNRPLTQPGVTTAVFPTPPSRGGSGRATPDVTPGSNGGSTAAAAQASMLQQSRFSHEVYILTSPEGPRALLVNNFPNSTPETFYSPRLIPGASHLRHRNLPGTTGMGPENHMTRSLDSPLQQPPDAQLGQNMQAQQQPQARDQHERPAAGLAHPNNPQAAALPPMLIQLWPHLWLILRLSLFVWFFTSPNTSWSRWLTILALAAFIFIVSTGALHGFADHVWRPLGRHLEHILPALDQAHIRRRPAPRPQVAGAAVHNGDLEPADLAARLQARGGGVNWLTEQVRRLERAGLLFLASIAPGVAERHIAHLEAEALAERQRQEAERQRQEAEAAAAEATQGTGEGDDGNDRAETGNEGQAPPIADDQGRQEEGVPAPGDGPEPAREQLIAL